MEPALTSGSNDPFKEMGHYIQGLIDKAKEEIKDFMDKFEESVLKVRVEIRREEEKSKSKLSDIIKELQDKLEAMAERGAKYKACVEKYRDPFKERVIVQSMTNFQRCFSDAWEQVIKIREDIEKHMKAMGEKIENLIKLIQQCDKEANIVEIVNCLKDKAMQIEREISKILILAIETITNANEEAAKVVSGAATCIIEVLKDAGREAEVIFMNIQDCVQ